MKLTYERGLMSGTIVIADFAQPTTTVKLDADQNEFVTKAISLLFGDFLLRRHPSPAVMRDVLEGVQMMIDNHDWAHSPEVARAIAVPTGRPPMPHTLTDAALAAIEAEFTDELCPDGPYENAVVQRLAAELREARGLVAALVDWAYDSIDDYVKCLECEGRGQSIAKVKHNHPCSVDEASAALAAWAGED